LNARLKRLLLPLLRDVKAGKPMGFRQRSTASQALFLLQKPKKKKVRAPAAGPSAHSMRTAEIRAAVEERASGVCEACGRIVGIHFCPWTMDHWLNGSGRRRQKQAVENCWALCGRPGFPGSCHDARQTYTPSVDFWNAKFAAHAAKYGYDPLPHIVHAPLPERKLP
jgi:hypothetical protein